MEKPRWTHNAIDFEIDRLDDHVAMTIRTDDEADHTFLFDPPSFARLFGEIAQLRAFSPDPKDHQK
jgi:hypothetical protein